MPITSYLSPAYSIILNQITKRGGYGLIKIYGGEIMHGQLKNLKPGSRLFAFPIPVAGMLTIVLLLTSSLNAQDTDLRFWLETGIGVATAGGGPETEPGGGVSLRAAARLQIEQLVFSVPVSLNSGGESNYDAFLGGRMRDEFNDVGLLVGYAFGHKTNMQFIVSSGISRVSGNRIVADTGECWLFCNGGKREHFKAVTGIPIEAGIYSLGPSAFGIGLTVHVNINREETFAGFSLSLIIGERD